MIIINLEMIAIIFKEKSDELCKRYDALKKQEEQIDIFSKEYHSRKMALEKVEALAWIELG